MYDCRPFADSADYKASVHSPQQRLEIRISRGIVSNDGVLDANANTVINQSSYRIEPRFPVSAKVDLLFEVDEQFRVRGFRKCSISALETSGVARITAGQHHNAREFILAQ